MRDLPVGKLVVASGLAQLFYACAAIRFLNERVYAGWRIIFCQRGLEPEARDVVDGVLKRLASLGCEQTLIVDPECWDPEEVVGHFGVLDGLKELWIAMPHNPVERWAWKNCGGAKKVIYQDGSGGFIPSAAVNWVWLDGFLRWKMRSFRARIRARIGSDERSYPWEPADLFIGFDCFSGLRCSVRSRQVQYIPVEDPEAIAEDFGIQTVVDANPLAALQSSTRPVAILIDGGLSTQQWCSVDFELKVYIEVVRALLERGYLVFFKPHPKAGARVGDGLEAAISDRDFARMPQSVIPVELCVPKRDDLVVVSALSTALFTLPASHGAAARTIAPSFLSEVRRVRMPGWRSACWFGDFVARTIPHFGVSD